MKIISKATAVILVAVIITGMIPSLESSAAAKPDVLRFTVMLMEEMIGVKAVDGKVIAERNDGKIKVKGNNVKNSTVKKYEKKYSLSDEEALLVSGAVKLKLLTSSELKKLKKKLTVAMAGTMISRAEEIIYGLSFTDDEIDTVINERIADISKVKGNTYKRGLAKAYMSGFIKGKAERAYSHLRLLSPSGKLSLKSARKLVGMLKDKSQRYAMSRDFQVLRNTKLPQNSSFYPYILDSFPNEYYDTGFNGVNRYFFDEGKGLGADSLEERMKRTNFSFVYPSEIEEFNALEYPGEAFSYKSNLFLPCYRNDASISELTKNSVEFYEHALNVDYRTILKDEEWHAFMEKFLEKEEIEDYVKHCIENKTIIECDLVSADTSAVYWYDGLYNCKVYAHFRVISDEPLKNGYTGGADQDTYGYLYPVRRGYEPGTLFTRSVLGQKYMGYKMGEWTDFFFNTNGISDTYGSLNCTNTAQGIMIDYAGLFPWLYKMPF